MAKINSTLIRVDPEMEKLVKRIIRKRRLLGKKTNSRKVTRKIAQMITEEEVLKDEFIKLQG